MTERMNMLRIAAPEQQGSDATFDPMKELKAADWDNIREEFQRVVESRNDEHLYRMAATILTVNPKERAVTASMRKSLKRDTSDLFEARNWQEIGHMAAFSQPKGLLKELSEPDLISLGNELGSSRSSVHGNISGNDPIQYIDAALLYKILAPEHPTFSEDVDFLQDKLKNHSIAMVERAHYAAALKVLAPDALKLDEELVSGCKRLIARWRQELSARTPMSLLLLCRELNIMTAERVEIKDRGLLVIPKARNMGPTDVREMPETPVI